MAVCHGLWPFDNKLESVRSAGRCASWCINDGPLGQ